MSKAEREGQREIPKDEKSEEDDDDCSREKEKTRERSSLSAR